MAATDRGFMRFMQGLIGFLPVFFLSIFRVSIGAATFLRLEADLQILDGLRSRIINVDEEGKVSTSMD